MNYMLLPTSPVLVLADWKGTRQHFKLSYTGVDNDAMLPHNVAFHTTFFFILLFLWQHFQVLDPGQIIAMCDMAVTSGRATLEHDILNSATAGVHHHHLAIHHVLSLSHSISVFMLLYCEHIFFLAGFVSQKGSQLALEGCLEPSCYDSSSRLAHEYPVLLAKE